MYAFYKTRGLDISLAFFNVLQKYGLETIEKSTSKLPIIVESFELDSLKRFAELSDLPLVYLMFWDNPLMTYNITEVAPFVHGVGPKSDWIFLYKNDQWNATSPSIFVEEAHSLDLAVHPYTQQDDMPRWAKTPLDEHEIFINKKVDGLFTEFPHTTKAAFQYHKSNNTFPGL